MPRSANDHSVGLEVLHVYVAGAAHQQLEGFKTRITKNIRRGFKRQQDLIRTTTHTSNSFSSNMASRFSGTSSFKPAIDQENTPIMSTLPEISNERNWQEHTSESSCAGFLFLTFEEMFHLISHLAGQSVLGQQVKIMHLVFIGYSDLSSARYQLHHLRESVMG